MNQILNIKENYPQKNKVHNKSSALKLQFAVSIILIVLVIGIYFFIFQTKNSKELSSHQIASNYNISKLYDNRNTANVKTYNQNGQIFAVIGMIEIPKISIYYPIISESNEKLLEISPCRISGPMPNENGNLCIAGHNYDNYKFFSKVSSLTNDDVIIIHDIVGNQLSYKVFKIYQVSASDLSPLDNDNNIKKQVTLITCNNFNSDNRIIIKASAE